MRCRLLDPRRSWPDRSGQSSRGPAPSFRPRESRRVRRKRPARLQGRRLQPCWSKDPACAAAGASPALPPAAPSRPPFKTERTAPHPLRRAASAPSAAQHRPGLEQPPSRSKKPGKMEEAAEKVPENRLESSTDQPPPTCPCQCKCHSILLSSARLQHRFSTVQYLQQW
ncbi:uncharacterized protein LOC109286356 isoform X2 [Alligator mississippiensis]|uniref:uncharacterized protein LOC109286356 isoform X2 n=1 Tax=Alligator mississippiensis TaxID=8496 RepID=UPI0009073ACB|nr:uncharacterized protein LOC109286356 isoform X2 [Alligator mississippiensis]